ncbi:cps1p [Saccharomyces arboricola H-6]|uniref:Cps1p n=1 Tax=Saccharomyces arboricola (strain H-6 / AS 2.3317 / CBS 10644) TaxID=1160507 RepID=J8LMB0_SACAR|nr:cps1p [Saccharomyces arboricola H-6]
MIGLAEKKAPKKSLWQRHRTFLGGVVALIIIGTFLLEQSFHPPPPHHGAKPPHGGKGHRQSNKCKKIEPLIPSFNRSIDIILHDSTFRNSSIEKLSNAIKIPTVVQDENPEPAEDPDYYEHFYVLHEYLEKTFPHVHEQLQLEKINELGLLYTWEGSEPELKPLLLMAHQDVVPVNNETISSWNFPPFSGHYDPETDFVWGRGSNDCKNLLIAEFEAVEQLLIDGFKPKRTVVMSLGFDEEASGILGASSLASFLHERYGDDSIYSIIDEGEGIVEVDKDVFVATPINTEKGYVDFEISILGHGGHSSVPPEHTTIGIASELITEFEANPFDYEFEFDNPIYGLLTCTAEHSKSLSKDVKKTILGAPFCPRRKDKLVDYMSKQPHLRSLIRTTQAVDIINGGVKANALPETTRFLINHRVNLHSSVSEVFERNLEYAKKVAKKYGYGLSKNGNDFIIPETDLGHIDVTLLRELEPAPLSPSSGPVWDVLAGTIQDVFENGVLQNNEEFYITTGLFSGNTDTKYYWNLSKNIYRFVGSIVDADLLKTLHSVNEHVDVPGHLSAIAFVYEYIVNVNEYA